ncbi:protein NRT1/ PTR FAMILY 1.2-like isoform X1 [Magnolia sinica]|uniref:protein NRT1/ PTR FAMILY 1.2-like isoform X1 n=2 Tax=Magnolia sinica TaxID=86752 RepID=UPI00265A03CF|nr:protein NRT1/ PTR FAMILY 1.2-like isoform X1 [Magnolia sinica]
MEVSMDGKEKTQKSSIVKGGIRTMPFIIANESFEKVASYGLLANMILYLTGEYHITIATGASILFIWSATTNFTPILGAFLSDSYLGRFRVIGLGCIISLLGMILLWLSAMLPGTKPPACHYPSKDCKSATHSQIALLFSAFALMSIGAGGIRPCSLAFGADQLDRPQNPNNARVLQSFFNWYYASVGVSIMLSVTVIVYIQDNKGWTVGFGVPTILMFFSSLLFFLGSPFYVKAKAHKSLFTGFAQVITVAVKNRRLDFPPMEVDGWYHHSKGSDLVAPTNKLRFLNKACIIRNPEKDIKADGSAENPWNLCTVEQVEDLKSLMKLIPIWSSGIMIAVTINQHSFPVLLAKTMDRHIGPKFQIPAGSYSVFAILTLTIWVAIYDRIVVPLLARVTGIPRGIGHKQRMGIGLLISCAATAVAAMVESARRRTAIRQGFADQGLAVVNMSAMWLVPQHCLTGLAEAFNAIGQIEFYYSELPKTMSSIGIALFSLGMGVGNLCGSLIIGIVNDVTKGGSHDSWVSNNPNKGHFDYYYWVLTILSFINFFYFIFCGWIYGPYKADGTKVLDDKEDEIIVEELSKSRELAVII